MGGITMQSSRFVAIALLTGILTGCTSAAEKSQKALESPVAVKTKSDPAVDFGKYKTWSFAPLNAEAQVDSRLDDPAVTSAFKDAVEREMFTRGYRRVEIAEGPDMIVNVHATIEKIDAAYIQQHYEGSYEPGYRTEVAGEKLAEEWDEGSIIVIIFDAKTRQGIWAAGAQAEVYKDLDPETRRQRMEKAIGLMMRSLPATK
jgi:hypothetical protein